MPPRVQPAVPIPKKFSTKWCKAENLSFWVFFFASAYLTGCGVFSSWALIPHQHKHSADDSHQTHRRRCHHSVSRLSLTDQIISLSQHTCGDSVFSYMLTRHRVADHMVSDVLKLGVCLRIGRLLSVKSRVEAFSCHIQSVLFLTAKWANTCDHTKDETGASFWPLPAAQWLIPGCRLFVHVTVFSTKNLCMYVTGQWCATCSHPGSCHAPFWSHIAVQVPFGVTECCVEPFRCPWCTRSCVTGSNFRPTNHVLALVSWVTVMFEHIIGWCHLVLTQLSCCTTNTAASLEGIERRFFKCSAAISPCCWTELSPHFETGGLVTQSSHFTSSIIISQRE